MDHANAHNNRVEYLTWAEMQLILSLARELAVEDAYLYT